MKIYITKIFLWGVLLLCGNVLFAQQRTITGKVTDENGVILPGVAVLAEGTKIGTSTDGKGLYSISIPSSVTILSYSFVGMQTLKQSVLNRSIINIALTQDNKNLEEVIVVGYGTVRKSDLTGSVGSVKADVITKIATADPVQALQGRVAGVDIVSNSGEPGAGTRIRIRGVGTINNSDPLYVVDGFQTGDISFLAPGDIQSMEILKDASATAIYGSRGANGVVVITTKRGKTGDTKISFESYVGIQKLNKQVELTNASEFATLRLEAFANDGTTLDPASNLSTVLNFVKDGNYKGTNWLNEIFQTAIVQNYSVNISGGNEKHKYSLTGTHFDQTGIVKNSPLVKSFIRFNNDFQVSKWIDGGLSAAYLIQDKTSYNGAQYGGIIPSSVTTVPLTPAFDPNTNYWGTPVINGGGSGNPARVVDEYKNNKNYDKLLNVNAFLDFKLTKQLSIRTQYGANIKNSQSKGYFGTYYLAPDDNRTLSTLTDNRRESFGWISSNYATYSNKLGLDHSITAVAGVEIQQSKSDETRITVFDVPNDPSQWYVGSSKNATPRIGSDASDESLLSYFGRFNYNFKNMLLLTGTLRRDGSSRFLPANRWGTFPSFAAAVNLHEFNFMKNLTAVSQLKLRAGWGQVGNQNAAQNYGYVTKIVPGYAVIFGDQQVFGAVQTQATNPNIKWETTTSTNIGFDAGLLNNKLSITADYFIKKTSDMIVRAPLPVFAGLATTDVNVGSVENKGFEFALGYNDKIGDLGYNVNMNFTKITNEVTSLGGGTPLAGGVSIGLAPTTLTLVGREIATFHGLKTDGIFNSKEELDSHAAIQPNAALGDVKFVDINNDGKIDDADRTYLGSATPDFSFGVNLGANYKGFDVSVFVQSVQGTEIVGGLDHWLKSSNGETNSLKSRLDRWTPTNTTSNEPRMTARDPNQNTRFSDRNVYDGSYTRIKNVTLGYTLPSSLLSKIKVSGLRVYVSADNLMTITKYPGFDPEVSQLNGSPLALGVDLVSYPQPKSYRVGLNLNF
ncbi:TonB-dependent receptor [Arcicella sp. LKC2W]|uniref:SusC/RagA family TonB-linked outer membrane protein n=1 Tax=Arcicella sp. LKC2W TaxID=2984198 RepID=UPI002B2204FA|nr:TonB-dependent receptor [Arcicella sp. LKC2W]MEA5461084.1 TonB-dependent receptor [Arcicella sp. LKC2W]